MALIKAKLVQKLKPEDLKWNCDPSIFDFETTTDVKPMEGIVGQERALKALRVGVDLKSPGYNIFITGLSGTGKFSSIKMMLEAIASDCENLRDYAYVNNFGDEDRPMLLQFAAGQAVKFKRDLERVIKFFQEKIPQLLEAEPFVSEKKKIISEFGQKQQKIMSRFEEKLKKDSFTLGQVKDGEMIRPEIFAVINKTPVNLYQLNDLVKTEQISGEQREQLINKYASYQEELQLVFRNSLKQTQ
ncbi:MAG: AAA family ATPase, partial [Ignavibacteria bacterium]|nr:AAA family ATPase [Ignavibacteria bacterium]